MYDLGLNQLDLYLVHFPIAQRYVPFEKRYPPGLHFDPSAKEPRVPISETWRAMERLVDDGLVKHIGICNFGTSLVRDLLSYADLEIISGFDQNRRLERFARSVNSLPAADCGAGAAMGGSQ